VKTYVRDNISISFEVGRLLRRSFADEYIIYMSTRDYFWNVTGSDSYRLCVTFDELTDASQARLDWFAERVSSARQTHPEIYNESNEVARLEFTNGIGMPADEMVSRLRALHERSIRLIEADIESCGGIIPPGTVDFLKNILRAHEKTARLLRKVATSGSSLTL
jgi:starvation-inducible DNA-binding protein